MVALRTQITVDDAQDYTSWLDSISAGRSQQELALIQQACEMAQYAHYGQIRATGEPYFLHSLTVAYILADLRLDHETIIAALLHDVPEDTEISLDDIRIEFGDTVAMLVDGVTKMAVLTAKDANGLSLAGRKELAQQESIRKMLLAMVEDIRVVLIKLADRTHNMRTLHPLKPDKQKRIARETMDIYAPLANRLGIWQIKWELEDRSFRYLQPDTYKQIAKMVAERRVSRERYIHQIITALQKRLKAHHVEAQITGRPKHIYSIWRKMRRKGVDFDQIFDVRAVRVIVDRMADCYATLGIVHTLWHPIPGEFDDYIAAPKDNLYQSLHTTVVGPDGKTLEVQIRTHEMHYNSEYGVAAHWRYKEGGKSDPLFDKKIQWLRQLMDWKDEVADAKDFVNNVKTEVFQDRVHVFSPVGDVYDLPQGATPIDFAYYIHTEVGHRCRGAKVNGRIVPLKYVLQNGDQVEVLTTKRGGPSRDWLNSELGYINTSRARTKARQWFYKQDREQNVTEGRATLDKILRRLSLTKLGYDRFVKAFNLSKVEDLLAGVGSGEITPSQIIAVINQPTDKPARDAPQFIPETITKPTIVPTENGQVQIQGVGNLATNIARCCQPVPGDDAIIGFITRGRGVTIHRQDCSNILHLSEDKDERLIEVSWGIPNPKDTFVAEVAVVAYDRRALVRDVTDVMAREDINISMINVVTNRPRNEATIYATLEVTDLDQLNRILTRIEQIPNIINAYRR